MSEQKQCCGTCRFAEVYAQQGQEWELLQCNAIVPTWAAKNRRAMLFKTSCPDCPCYQPGEQSQQHQEKE